MISLRFRVYSMHAYPKPIHTELCMMSARAHYSYSQCSDDPGEWVNIEITTNEWAHPKYSFTRLSLDTGFEFFLGDSHGIALFKLKKNLTVLHFSLNVCAGSIEARDASVENAIYLLHNVREILLKFKQVEHLLRGQPKHIACERVCVCGARLKVNSQYIRLAQLTFYQIGHGFFPVLRRARAQRRRNIWLWSVNFRWRWHK